MTAPGVMALLVAGVLMSGGCGGPGGRPGGGFVPTSDAAAADADATGGMSCAPASDGSRIQLVDHAQWRVAEVNEDPFASARPADDISCPLGAREVEEFAGTPSYSVETADCPYTTLVQPLQVDACAGDVAYVWLWHFQLTAPAAAQAHLAVQIGDDVLWGRALAIPSESALFTEDVPIDQNYTKGTPVYLHVRNHGSNSYNLLEFSLKR